MTQQRKACFAPRSAPRHCPAIEDLGWADESSSQRSNGHLAVIVKMSRYNNGLVLATNYLPDPFTLLISHFSIFFESLSLSLSHVG